MAYLDNTGLSYFWGKIKSTLSSKQNKITASGILKGDGAGGITAAEAGTDYAATSLGLTGAAVGQAAAVKSVDADGKPTAWEPKSFQEEPFTIAFTLQRYGLGKHRVVSSKTGEQIVAAFKAGLWVTASLEGVQLDVSADNSSGGYDFVCINADGTIAGVRLKITDVTDMDTGEIIKNYSFVQIQYQCMQGPAGSSIAQNALWGTDENGVWTTVYSIALGNLPAVSAADNGKFLRVVNGAWAIAEVDNANGGSF